MLNRLSWEFIIVDTFSGYLRWLLRLNGSKTDFLMEQMESETNLLSVL